MGINAFVELRHLRYFAAVAEARHFGRAAARLRIAQPPLSRQIQALEAELGFSLLDRSKKRVELTPAGAVLARHVQKIFATIDTAVHEATRAAAGDFGRLAIGYSTAVALSGFSELLRAFREKAPGVELVLREKPAQVQLQAIRAGELDVGFVRGDVDLEDDTLQSRRVRREPLLMVLPSDHALAKKKRIALGEVARDPFVLWPRGVAPMVFDYLMRLCHGAGFTPQIAQEATQLDIVSLVSAGFGVSILPASFEAARRPGVVFLPIVGSPSVELFVVWRRADTSLPLKEFLELVPRLAALSS